MSLLTTALLKIEFYLYPKKRATIKWQLLEDQLILFTNYQVPNGLDFDIVAHEAQHMDHSQLLELRQMNPK